MPFYHKHSQNIRNLSPFFRVKDLDVRMLFWCSIIGQQEVTHRDVISLGRLMRNTQHAWNLFLQTRFEPHPFMQCGQSVVKFRAKKQLAAVWTKPHLQDALQCIICCIGHFWSSREATYTNPFVSYTHLFGLDLFQGLAHSLWWCPDGRGMPYYPVRTPRAKS